ncbi:MAG: hypothetical protein NT018_05680 [Armatimonadetes bacterium]|nr:hypothetical protein [Armatimonadota bacterium]
MQHANSQIFIIIMAIAAIILYKIFSARSGKEIYIRRIAGLKEIDEAVGRATEMGRPMLFNTGNADFTAAPTLAAIGVLGHVAQTAAKMGARVIVFTCVPVVIPVAEDVVKGAYAAEGRPELFDAKDIRFLAAQGDQTALASAQIMKDEKTASHFYFGSYDFTALLYTEPGQHVGAVQIAGCAEPNQIPFFIATCDYTVIGEELYAAGAYLTREPTMLGSIVGQDYCKIAILLVIIAGTLLVTFGSTSGLAILYNIFGK